MKTPGANGANGGFLKPIIALLDGVAGAVQDRVELVRADAQAEKVRLLESFLLALTIVALGALSLALLTLGILVFAWRGGFYIAVTCLTIGCTVGAGAAWRRLRERMFSAPFSEISDQIARDRQRLQRFG